MTAVHPTEAAWTGVLAEITIFARVLYAADRIVLNPNLGIGDDIFYYLEKPWKWNPEHEVWTSWGSPQEGEPGWELFVKALDRLDKERSR